MLDKAKQLLSKLNLDKSKAAYIRYIAYIIVALLIVGMILYTVNKMRLNKLNCENIDKLYTSFPKLSSININDAAYKYKLRDYYVKTAYNSCCGGQFKNDYVNVCALKKCIQQGARVLDFEIYSVNDEPVIATSAVENYMVKETYNKVGFDEALNVINNYAFKSIVINNV